MSESIEQEMDKDTPTRFKYLKFEIKKDIYVVTLHDNSGYDIIRGYGKTMVDAIDDMHSCLL